MNISRKLIEFKDNKLHNKKKEFWVPSVRGCKLITSPVGRGKGEGVGEYDKSDFLLTEGGPVDLYWV